MLTYNAIEKVSVRATMPAPVRASFVNRGSASRYRIVRLISSAASGAGMSGRGSSSNSRPASAAWAAANHPTGATSTFGGSRANIQAAESESLTGTSASISSTANSSGDRTLFDAR